jgi:hypothetical protein
VDGFSLGSIATAATGIENDELSRLGIEQFEKPSDGADN